MNQTISTRDLKIGMYVVEIDRPWTETPFMMQGFLLQNVEQVRALQQCCREVVIDRARSTGDQFSAKVIEKDGPLLGSDGRPRQHPDVTESRVEAQRFLKVARSFKGKIHTTRLPHVPRIRSEDGRSRLESELLYSAPIVDDIYRVLRETRLAIDANGTIDVERIDGLVGEMASGVQRNPDALLWLSRLKRTDQYAYDHAVNVSVHAMVFARFVGLSGAEVRQLGTAGLLQDIGKLRLPARLLHKIGALSPREYEIFKTHVDFSLHILAACPHATPQMLEIIERHHERCDGSGYPAGLKGDDVGLMAEIAGVCDVYCAMTRERPYGAAVSSQDALDAVRGLRGKRFSVSIVDQFVQCIGLYPVGTLVELNSGEVAVVVSQNRIRRLKPRVMILLGPDKKPNAYPQTLDLLYDPSCATGEPYEITRALPPGAFGVEPSAYYLA